MSQCYGMTKILYCELCEEEATFTYHGQGDWQCEKGHLLAPDDAFQDFRNDGTNGVGPFRVNLIDDPSSVVGFIHAHDGNGIKIDTCEVVEDGCRSWTPSMFIPWARIKYVRLLTEAEEKSYRERLKA